MFDKPEKVPDQLKTFAEHYTGAEGFVFWQIFVDELQQTSADQIPKLIKMLQNREEKVQKLMRTLPALKGLLRILSYQQQQTETGVDADTEDNI